MAGGTARGSRKVGCRKQGTQGVPPMAVPPCTAAAPTPEWTLEALLWPCCRALQPSVPSSVPTATASPGKSPCALRGALGMLESLPSHGTSRAPREASSSGRAGPGSSSQPPPSPALLFVKQQLLHPMALPSLCHPLPGRTSRAIPTRAHRGRRLAGPKPHLVHSFIHSLKNVFSISLPESLAVQ